jgi:hypothetical protein
VTPFLRKTTARPANPTEVEVAPRYQVDGSVHPSEASRRHCRKQHDFSQLWASMTSMFPPLTARAQGWRGVGWHPVVEQNRASVSILITVRARCAG